MSIEEANEPLARGIQKIISQKGIKQVYVAEKAGLGKQQLNDMLNGRRIIKPCDAFAIAKALQVTMDDLYGINSHGT